MPTRFGRKIQTLANRKTQLLTTNKVGFYACFYCFLLPTGKMIKSLFVQGAKKTVAANLVTLHAEADKYI